MKVLTEGQTVSKSSERAMLYSPIEGNAKKVAEGSDTSRKYVARVGLKLEVALAIGV